MVQAATVATQLCRFNGPDALKTAQASLNSEEAVCKKEGCNRMHAFSNLRCQYLVLAVRMALQGWKVLSGCSFGLAHVILASARKTLR